MRRNSWIGLLTAVILTMLATGCHDHRCDTPIGAANCTIDPNSPLYNRLNNVGGYEYLIGGNKGIFVLRTSYNEFLAYERTCPHCKNVAVEATEGWDGAVLECPECGSKFSTYTDGSPLDGSATPCPLYQYSTIYSNGNLSIY